MGLPKPEAGLIVLKRRFPGPATGTRGMMELSNLEIVATLALGLGLAAAAGFRVFVPLLLAGLAARTGSLPLTDTFAWLASDPALVLFGIAALLEVLAYFIPFFDHLLDAAAQPAAVVAGALLMAATLVELPPWARWTVAVIVGGGASGMIQASTGAMRAGSTMTTAGLGNPFFALFETGAAAVLTAMAIAIPLLALAIVVVLLTVSVRGIRKLLRRRRSLPGR